MGAEWLSAALPYIGGGVLGSAVTYGLTWVREHRRTLDSYRARKGRRSATSSPRLMSFSCASSIGVAC
jgi:hypothetical protein